MSKFTKVVTLIMAVILWSSLTSSMALAQDPDNGKIIWEEQVNCKQCHGDAGQGAWSGPLAGTDESAEAWIEQARTPRNNMPSYSADQVSDAMITDMQAYLASLTAPADFAPRVADLPADAPAGQQLMADKKCVACHSETGPINGFINRGELPTAETVLAQVRTPRNTMPAYSAEQVSDEEVSTVVDFLAMQVTEQLGEETTAEESAAPAEESVATEEAAPVEEAAPAEPTPVPQPETPATMPASGGTLTTNLPLLLMVVGGSLLLAGWALRRFVVSIPR